MLWTVSYAQTGKIEKTCYTTEELRKIASKLLRASEFDKLEPLYITQLKMQDSIIALQNINLKTKDSIIMFKDDILYKKDTIIAVKDIKITNLNVELTDNKKKLKLVKVGWAATTGALLTLMFLIVR